MKHRVCLSASLLLLLHAGNSTLFPRWQMVLPLPLSGVCTGTRNSRSSVGSCSAKTAEEKYFPSENDRRRQHLRILLFRADFNSGVKDVLITAFSDLCSTIFIQTKVLHVPRSAFHSCFNTATSGSSLRPTFCIHINLRPPLSSSNFLSPSSSPPSSLHCHTVTSTIRLS